MDFGLYTFYCNRNKRSIQILDFNEKLIEESRESRESSKVKKSKSNCLKQNL